MRRADGTYQCENCGEMVELPRRGDPRIVIVQGSGRTRDEFVVSLDRRELHRCPVRRGPLSRTDGASASDGDGQGA